MTEFERRGWAKDRYQHLRDALTLGEGNQFGISARMLECSKILYNLWGIMTEISDSADVWPAVCEEDVAKLMEEGYDIESAISLAYLLDEADRIGVDVLFKKMGAAYDIAHTAWGCVQGTALGRRYLTKRAAEWDEVKSTIRLLYGYDLIEDRRVSE